MAFPTTEDPERLHDMIDAISLIDSDVDLDLHLIRIVETANEMAGAQSRRIANGEMVRSEQQLTEAKARLLERASENVRLESLSPQERRILELLSQGLSNREIANTLFLAEKTVKNYVSHLLAKLGFQHRTEAALYAQRHQRRRRIGD